MKRIDDSHQPFKRTAKIGPGPKKADPIRAKDKYVCRRASPTKTHYVQICAYKGADGSTHQVKIKTSKAKKKAYNKVYKAWAKKHRKALVAKPARASYKCRKTAVAKCR